jgi:hypothetical protein
MKKWSWQVCVVCAITSLNVGANIDSGSTTQQRAFTSGGASVEELNALYERREAFSLWLITAAKRSGAHLAEVQVRITDANQRVVLDTQMQGPWLMVDLALGRYTIEARFNGQVQKRVSTIHSGDHHQAFFYFDVADEVSPDPQRPFLKSPYGR